MSTFAQSNDGEVHLISPIGGGEHTLCGNAFDIDSEPDGVDFAWVECEPRPLTCPLCAMVVKACRGVAIAD